MKFDKAALIESLQEIGRLALFAVLSVLVSYALNKLTGVPQTEVVVLGTFLLKLADKYINENKYTKINGLTDTKIFLK